MPELSGNLVVAQSGGPTAVINASLAGVIQEAGRHEAIEEIYGARHGILGVLNEDFIDINEQKARTIEGLKYTPAAALGTCRYKIDFTGKPEQAARDMDRLFEVFQAHNIRYFLYIGGNDSQDTAHKIHEQARQRGYDLRVNGIPKTIDNDLPFTDHCPGFGSAAKYAAATVMEIATDVSSMATEAGMCCLVEVMGRRAGWLAAATALARRSDNDAPHIILTPEVPLNEQAFLEKVRDVCKRLGTCVVVVGEGVKNSEGQELAADKSRLDAFGHPLLSGAADHLAGVVRDKLKMKARAVRLSYALRAAAHFGSATDAAEAAECGAAAVRAAVSGQSGFMVKLVRNQTPAYRCSTELQPLQDIANQEHMIPREWLTEDGFLPNETFLNYARPLIAGEVKVAMENGLPRFVTLEPSLVEKKLPARAS